VRTSGSSPVQGASGRAQTRCGADDEIATIRPARRRDRRRARPAAAPNATSAPTPSMSSSSPRSAPPCSIPACWWPASRPSRCTPRPRRPAARRRARPPGPQAPGRPQRAQPADRPLPGRADRHARPAAPRRRDHRTPARHRAKTRQPRSPARRPRRGNRLRHGVEHFAGRVRAVIDQLDHTQRQALLRLLIDDVQVTGWHVKIKLRIPLDQPPGDDHPRARTPRPTPAPADSRTPQVSTEDRLRSLHVPERRQLPAQRPRPRPGPPPASRGLKPAREGQFSDAGSGSVFGCRWHPTRHYLQTTSDNFRSGACPAARSG
jgi:hypothetical protein